MLCIYRDDYSCVVHDFNRAEQKFPIAVECTTSNVNDKLTNFKTLKSIVQLCSVRVTIQAIDTTENLCLCSGGAVV